MVSERNDPFNEYAVVMNHEEQYSIWPTALPVPGGWDVTGFTGSKEACVEEIDRVWVDMRPASLRRQMEEAEHDA